MKKILWYKHVLSVILSLSIVFFQIITISATSVDIQADGSNSASTGKVKLIDEDLNDLGVEIDNESEKLEEENDPDGPCAFRRRAGCQYYAVRTIFFVVFWELELNVKMTSVQFSC